MSPADCRPRVAVAFPCLALLLAGCTAFERGAEQGDPTTDPVTGCPDLTGSYAMHPLTADGDPDPGVDASKPSRLDGAVFSPRARAGNGAGAGNLGQYSGVVVRSDGTHAIELHFLRAHGDVMAELESIRQHQGPRYEEWFALMQPSGRAAFVERNGEAALQARMRELGPRIGQVVRLDRGRDFTCEDGWVILPREFLPPVRMTLDEGRHLVFESKEWTYTVWGGWGGQSWQAPTGAYLGTARWMRDGSVQPWDADQVSRSFVFARPAGEIEQEQAVAAANAQRSAERRFADPDAVREALKPLLPAGITIQSIEIAQLPFIGHRVRVHAVPSDSLMDGDEQWRRLEWFLAALKEGDPGYIEDREVVKRVISSGGVQRHEFEIYLDSHPAVQRPRDRVLVSFTPAPGSEPPATGPSLSEASSLATPRSGSSKPASSPSPQSHPMPPGFAPLPVIEARLQPLLARGCRSTQLRYSGGAVIIVGAADDMPCVSQTLRALDGALSASGARAELMQIAADGAGRYRFEIRLPASPLTAA